MAYEIQSGPAPETKARPRGAKARYPLRDMEVWQWFPASADEWPRLRNSIRYAHRKHGLRFQVMPKAGDHRVLIVTRVPR